MNYQGLAFNNSVKSNNNYNNENINKRASRSKTKSNSKSKSKSIEKSNKEYYLPKSTKNSNLDNSLSKSLKGRYQDKESKLFKSLKDKTHPFFKNSMIDSCSHVIVKNGQTLAIPFNIKNSKGRNLSHYKTIPTKSSELMSIYRKDFSVKPILHCGMLKKPLEPYNPMSYRNRLPNFDCNFDHINKSNIEIGNPSRGSRKQWISTYRDTYTTPVFLPICNTGILSDISKKIHKKLMDI